MFLIFAWVGAFLIPLRYGYLGNQIAPETPYLAWVWANFDGRHLIEIATYGYENFNFAYFPLFPSLISIFGYAIKVPHIYLGILISLLSLFGAMVYLYKVAKLDFKEKVAKASLLFLSIFPLSFFYQAAYTDSLFLFLSTASFYYARKNKWLLSGLFGGFATATRMAGIALVVGLFVEWLIQNKDSFQAWKRKPLLALQTGFVGIILSSFGLLTYLIYLQVFHGDFLLFQKSFSAWQQSSITFPPQVVFRYLKIFASVNPTQFVFWVAALEFICTISYFALTWYVARKIKLSYGIFMFLLFLLPTFSGTFAGMPRYVLHTFPAFLGLAVLLQSNKLIKMITLCAFILLGLVFTALYTRGYFVA